MALLNREDILAAKDVHYEDIDVPEWGGQVRVRALTGTARDKYEASIIQQNGENRRVNLLNARTKLVVLALVDENMRPVFTAEDVNELGRKSAKALGRVFDKARQLAGMTEDDVERLSENFGADPSDEGTSD